MSLLKNTYGDFPEKERLLALHKAHTSITRLAIELELDLDQPSRLVKTAQLLPNLEIYEITASSNQPRQPHSHAADKSREDFSLLIPINGSAIIRPEHKNPAYCLSGDAMLISNNLVHCTHAVCSIFLAVISVPKVLVPVASNLDGHLVEKIAIASTPELHLLTGYIRTLMKMGEDNLPTGTALLASTQIQDMVTLLIGGKREELEIIRGRKLRVARLKAVKNDVEKHIVDSKLTINQVAQRQGISPQYIRSLFRSEKTTFNEYVIKLRLEQVCRLLRNSFYANYSISAMAFDVGFNNLSWFNRAFKAHFGMTPSELRDLFIPCHHNHL